ncbi:hypothetical protein G6F56_001719 [Rhizopus delemar]|uniref:Uncharacterized protein n=1 Tax=Rhizopus stolonifer TaxID=4846 RepID=A0A367JL96_RHIST|nr:hypothetical protein G6F56_001719 [Rhizopus delemar]RCH90639.1 hypothetical protein CU098_009703 [Rhizopus stolonifer]
MTEENLQEKVELLYSSWNINPLSITFELNEPVDFGKIRSQVSPFDITVYRPDKQKEKKDYTTEELMEHGTKLMDASLYQYIHNKNWVSFSQKTQGSQINSPSDIGEALFCVFHFFLQNGSTLSSDSIKQEKIPKFIRNVVKNPKPLYEYSKTLASFDITRLDKSWFKRIRLYGIPPLIKRRLTLGALGHRILDIFRIFEPENFRYSGYRESYYNLLSCGRMGPYWDIFPWDSDFVVPKWFRDVEHQMIVFVFQIYTNAQIEKMEEYGLFSILHGRKYKRQNFEMKFDFCSFTHLLKNYVFKNDIISQPEEKVLSSKLIFPLFLRDPLAEKSGSKKNYGIMKAYVSFDP